MLTNFYVTVGSLGPPQLIEGKTRFILGKDDQGRLTIDIALNGDQTPYLRKVYRKQSP